MVWGVATSNAVAAFARRLASVAGTAMILLFFSEFLFVNDTPVRGLLQAATQSPRPVLAIAAHLGQLTLVYGIFAYLFLCVLGRFGSRSSASLVLALAVMGWSVESLVVPVVYEAPPWSLMWPGLGWHVLVDGLAGWVLMRRVLHRGRPAAVALYFAALGLVWGLWASWAWIGTTGARLEPREVILTAVLATPLLVVGAWLMDRAGAMRFRPSRSEVFMVFGFCALLFGASGRGHLPLALVLAGLVGLSLLAMARERARPGALVPLLRPRVPPPGYLYLLAALTPAVAGVTYAALSAGGRGIPTDIIVPLMTLAGAALYLWALVAALLRA